VNRRLWFVGAAVLAVTLVLAFPLRALVERAVILPAAYLIWLARLFYDATPQILCWTSALILVLLAAWSGLFPGERYSPPRSTATRGEPGAVQGLASWIGRAERGIYYRWLVAHRLGELAHRMLVQREHGRPRSVFAPLVGSDWQPRAELQAYLEHGLHGSFADFPHAGWPFRRRQPTPLDLNIAEAVDFLESKTEMRHESAQ
jgi:hypothetical protein